MKEVEKKYGILAWPAFKTKDSNPYNYLIYHQIEQKGFHVMEFDFNLKNILKFAFSNDFEIFHIHWPTNILTYSNHIQAKRRIIMLRCFLTIIKLRGKKAIWTVHNLNGHEKDHPLLQEELNNLLYKQVDGFISLNKAGVDQIKSKAIDLRNQYFSFIPHPHYSGYYPNSLSKKESRQKLNIPEDRFVFLFLGQIRKYKNVSGLIKAFHAVKLPDKHLLIAGNIHHDLEHEITSLCENNPEITLYNRFVSNEDLQCFFNASDLVVTPYKDIFNSGSVFLNLSFNKPTLCPNKGVFNELSEEVGNDVIILYDGDISPESLESAVDKVKSTREFRFNSDKFSPAYISERTIAFYNQVLKNKKSDN
ncbi:glycosyl transferase group 1 [Pseudopedobacter saltans DSM 12145]|uniref:Glycosyl transferase group 1 n=1 Tax=Pseudopedobacter saltans (strain ATCC 51119 / DSM 12145 / JCM 21818 / CCUG 39354 / LMG 10337 / NBRC 100064 / NCIMB 13643) TaxID=762903 RepID=F0SB02_PSESL|nr:glycosyltransferase [Pseudopedobacter saltans]ADY51597.1 glycosyl transferase group 1 [Pseudopedobacter saltans DSM 12145]